MSEGEVEAQTNKDRELRNKRRKEVKMRKTEKERPIGDS